jgi:hypothetical protein
LPVAPALAAIIMAGSGFRLRVASKDVQRGVHGKAARALVLRMALKEASPVAAWPDSAISPGDSDRTLNLKRASRANLKCARAHVP